MAMKDTQAQSRSILIAAVAIGMLASALERAMPQPRPAALPWQGAHAGEDAGAGANSPAEIPARGWWHVLKRVVAQFVAHRIMAEAAAVAFYGLLALFPALAAFVSLYGFVADPKRLAAQLGDLNGVVPQGGVQIITDQLNALTSHGSSALGFGLVIGLATSLWSANAGIKSLFDALNVVYDEKEKRSFIRLTLLGLCFTLGGIFFLILALIAIVALPVVLTFVGLGAVNDLLLRFGRWPLLIVVMTLALAVLYRYGPSRAHPRWRWVSWGGAMATVLWVVVSALFSWYVGHFGSYNRTYGSLGAVAGFMTWIWISTMVVLSGAEVDAELEHQTGRDTTVGPERRMGERGATKADQVAG